MKLNLVLFILVLMLSVSVILMTGCCKSENAVPSVEFKQPSGNSSYFNGDSILVSVDSEDSDGTVTSVEIFIDSKSLGSIDVEPYRGKFMIEGFQPGQHILRVEATDDQGDKAEAEVNIIILTGPDTFTDPRDGHVYKYVNIGPQVWMAENLAYMPEVSPISESSDSTPLIYVLGYNGTDISEARNDANYVKYGAHYNWEAAKCCCPDGWHLPSDSEWRSLESYLNSLEGPFNKTEYYTMYAWWGIGLHLKHTSGWYQDLNGINTYGFSALPAGGVTFPPFPSECGVCLDPFNQKAATWWTATMKDELVYVMGMWMDYPDNMAKQYNYPPEYGLSVRCVRDD